MPDVSAHSPGAFSWVELATTEPKAAVTFYRALLGWDAIEHDMGADGLYTIFTVRDRDVAAAAGLQPQDREMGIPPHWKLYVTVADADASATRVAELGGTVDAQPFEVMDYGRMAVIQDPTGAMINLWQPKGHIGAKVVAEPGALCWSELYTRDPRAAEAFYTALFGWGATHTDFGGGVEYTSFSVAGQPGIGMMRMPKEMPSAVPAYWMPYFQVTELDGAISTAKELHGILMIGPAPIPGTGRFAILQDPQGAVFAIFQG